MNKFQTEDDDLETINANIQFALLKKNPKRSIKQEFEYRKLMLLGLIWRLKYRIKYGNSLIGKKFGHAAANSKKDNSLYF